jgi:ribosomal protein L11 methyltransferase
VPAANVERLIAELHDGGTLGVEVLREGETHELLAYFPVGQRPPLEPLSRLGARADEAPVPDVDWVARFREQFQGARAGRFRIRPVWREPEPVGPDELTLLVDPGGAFGTGTHETTRLCLLELERIPPGGLVVDVGCGTGLLALAALARGWRRALAIDVDPAAVAEARRHALLNHAPLAVVLGDGVSALRGACCELLLANLARDLLLARAGDLARALVPGGTAILSGLLREELPDVERELARFGRLTARFEGEWAALRLETGA